MSWIQKITKRRKKPKVAGDRFLSPALASSTADDASVAQIAGHVLLPHAPREIIGVNMDIGEANETQMADTTVDETQSTHKAVGIAKKSAWISRIAFILSLTKSAADAGGLAPLKGACEGMVTVLDAVQAVEGNRSAWRSLVHSIRAHVTAFKRQLDQLGIDDVLESANERINGPITEYLTTLNELLVDVCVESKLDESEINDRLTFKLLAQRMGTTKLESDVITGYEKRLKDAEWEIMRSLVVHITVSVDASSDAEILSRLRGPQYKRPNECQPGTRTDILAQCVAWSLDLAAPNILWIKAPPGAGKSAIASSLVGALAIKKKRLGSSFFFERQASALTTTSSLWQNTAYDIARHPTIRKHLSKAIRHEEIDLMTPNIDDTFHQLIVGPLSKIRNMPVEDSPIIIVDALDECGGLEGARSEDRQQLMRTLISWSKLPPNFKIIVTSREENDIARTFARIPVQIIDLLVGEETAKQSKQDIQAFLTKKFQHISAEYSTLPVDWPGDATIERLATKANGLFIWASTVVKYVAGGNVERLLKEVADGKETGDMGVLYAQVVRNAFPKADPETMQDLRAIVGAIIVAKKTLTVTTMASLLSIASSTVEYICNGLRSVIEHDGGLRFRHQSFVDFLLYPGPEASELLITISTCEQTLAARCLQVMNQELRFNICNIPSSYLLNDQITEATIDDHISPHLAYVSRHWMEHLVTVPLTEMILNSICHFLKAQFLFWLEVASLHHFMSQTPRILASLTQWLKRNDLEELVPLAVDFGRFIAHFDEPISCSVPHIYLSALPFSPPKSKVQEIYGPQYPRTLRIATGGLQRWSPLLNTLSDHDGGVTAVACFPDGRIVSGSDDMAIRIWDLEKGELLMPPLEGHHAPVTCIALSPDGQQIISGSEQGEVLLWNAGTGERHRVSLKVELEGPNCKVTSIAFSPDGNLIATGFSDSTIRLWNAESGQQIRDPFAQHAEYAYAIAFSPSGRYMASGSSDAMIHMWDVDTGREFGLPFSGHIEPVLCIAFSRDGRLIVSGSDDRSVRLWDTISRTVLTAPMEGHTGSITSVLFSEDDRYIISGSYDKTIRIWEAQTGQNFGPPLDGHAGAIVSMALYPQSQYIISGSDDGTVQIWTLGLNNDYQPEQTPVTQLSTVMAVAISPDEHYLASGSNDGKIRFWDLVTGRELCLPFEGSTSMVWTIAFSPDGRYLVSGSDDGEIFVWDVESRVQLLTSYHHGVRSIGFFPDNRRIASKGDDNMVQLWDLETDGPVRPPFEVKRPLGLSWDGRRVASTPDEHIIQIWDVETCLQCGPTLDGHGGIQITSVTFSPDGRRVASISDDATVRIWDVESGALCKKLDGIHTDGVTSIAFSPDGQFTVSGSLDGTVQIWSIEPGQDHIFILGAHLDSVESVALSSDGRRAVSGSSDDTIHIWDIPTIIESSRTYSWRPDEGWMFGPNSALLLWIPYKLRSGLEVPGIVTIGDCIRTRLDMSGMCHGEEWIRVKEGGMILDGI